METKKRFCKDLSEAQESLTRDIVDRVASRWSLWTLGVLFRQPEDEPLRFARLLEQVLGISQKVLTQTLRGLERDGLISRQVYAQVPPRVEYRLTPVGRELYRQFLPFWEWTVARLPDFHQARADYDHRQQVGG